MTFLELCQRYRQEVGAAGSGPAAVTGQNGEYKRLIDWIVQAWREIQMDEARWFFSWAQASVDVDASFRDYSPPTNMGVWDATTLYLGEQKLAAMDWDVFKVRYREDSQAPVPTVITQLPDGTLRLDTTPSAAGKLTFDYFRTPQELVNASDTPRLPKQYHMLIVYRAMQYYALYENAPEVMSAARRGDEELLDKLMQRQTPPVTLGGPLA